ncbi:hypothetical protein COO60DRAFT_801723 [Scenedesmus sp. NREL 46B-D3]|nr:hypothetical protein COO60DRAFT_801723 [Scenedesmus sp. NREL 46B-D3]
MHQPQHARGLAAGSHKSCWYRIMRLQCLLCRRCWLLQQGRNACQGRARLLVCLVTCGHAQLQKRKCRWVICAGLMCVAVATTASWHAIAVEGQRYPCAPGFWAALAVFGRLCVCSCWLELSVQLDALRLVYGLAACCCC